MARENPDVFGINCSTHTFLTAIEVLRKLRELLPDSKLVMGGIQATFAAPVILRDYPFVDYIIKGEAERAFPQLLECIKDGKSPAGVLGISYLDGAGYVSKPSDLIEDLNTLPFPSRDLLGELEYGYFHGKVRLTFGKFTSISSSRGCPFSCAYCSCAAFSLRRWRARSPENVVEELSTLQSEGYEVCVFVDDTFTISAKRVEKICDLIQASGIKMRMYCEGRVDLAPYWLLKRMKDAGFDVIYFGVESASKRVLDYYQKTISAEQSARAIENAKKAGMIAIASFIVGAPIESSEDLRQTLDLIQKTRPHGVQLNILDCLLGTPIWDDLVEEGFVGPDDWKRNHRIYEYDGLGSSRSYLERVVESGYAAHLDAWKNGTGLLDLMHTVLSNSSARRVVLGNLFNRNALHMVSGNANPHHLDPLEKQKHLQLGSPAGEITDLP